MGYILSFATGSKLAPGPWVLCPRGSCSVVTCHWKNGLEEEGEGSEQRTESRFCLKSRFSCEKLEAMRELLLANKNNPCIDPK